MLLSMHVVHTIMSTSVVNTVLNVDRTCPTRIAIGMSSASSVPSVAALWWKRPLQPRMISCSARSATPLITPPSVPPARKPSCQVYAARMIIMMNRA